MSNQINDAKKIKTLASFANDFQSDQGDEKEGQNGNDMQRISTE